MERVYVTKFALTKGIVVADATRDPKSAEHVIVRGGYPWESVRLGLGDWHTDREAAVKRAKDMAQAKAQKMEREAEMLQNKEFEVPLL